MHLNRRVGFIYLYKLVVKFQKYNKTLFMLNQQYKQLYETN